jgi:hypothetical protein
LRKRCAAGRLAFGRIAHGRLTPIEPGRGWVSSRGVAARRTAQPGVSVRESRWWLCGRTIGVVQRLVIRGLIARGIAVRRSIRIVIALVRARLKLRNGERRDKGRIKQ